MEPKNRLLCLFLNLVGSYKLGYKVETVNLTESFRESNIQSANYPMNTGPGTNITWVVSAPDGTGLIRLHCTDIYLPKSAACSRGVLSISDLGVNSSRVNICSQTTSYIWVSMTNRMTVQFTTGARSEGRLNCVVELTNNRVIRPDFKQTSCSCGGKKKNPNYYEENEFPFFVYIKKQKKNYTECAGSILTQRHILTLAYCATKHPKQKLEVLVVHFGNYNDEDTIAQTLNVTKIYTHENYSKLDDTNDIGLLFLSEDIEFNHVVKPVCLPTEHYHLEKVRVVGRGPGNRVLPCIDLQVVDFKKCHSIFSYTNTSPSSILCTKSDYENYFGSPLVYKDPELEGYVQVGLAPFAGLYKEGPLKGWIANFDIYPYLYWIQNKIADSQRQCSAFSFLFKAAEKGNSPKYRTCEKLEQRPLS